MASAVSSSCWRRSAFESRDGEESDTDMPLGSCKPTSSNLLTVTYQTLPTLGRLHKLAKENVQMRDAPILLIGGSGIVGRRTARLLRDANPDAKLLIGGRNLARAQQVAAEIGSAEGVAVDLDADDLGLGESRPGERPLAAVVIFLKDARLAALRFAQARGAPHIGISSGTFEIGPEVSAFIHKPGAAPVVLGSEWLAGAAVLATLHLARKF